MSINVRSQTRAMGFERINVLTTAQALQPPVGAELAIIQSEAQAVRWRDDGVMPTAAVGMPLEPGRELRYDGLNPATGSMYPIHFIEQTPGASLSVCYYAFAPS